MDTVWPFQVAQPTVRSLFICPAVNQHTRTKRWVNISVPFGPRRRQVSTTQRHCKQDNSSMLFMFLFAWEDWHTVVGEGSVFSHLGPITIMAADLTFGLQQLWTDSSQHAHLWNRLSHQVVVSVMVSQTFTRVTVPDLWRTVRGCGGWGKRYSEGIAGRDARRLDGTIRGRGNYTRPTYQNI